MTNLDKTIEKIKNNPRDWRITDLENIAGHFGILIRKGNGSHVSFTHPSWMEILTIPAHRPIKPVYVKKFILLIEQMKQGET